MSAPALPPPPAATPAQTPAATLATATAPPEPPPSRIAIKDWLALTVFVGGPLAFGIFAALNDTGAAVLAWLMRLYDKLTVAAFVLGAILWVIDKVGSSGDDVGAGPTP